MPAEQARRILFVIPNVPYPPQQGSALRNYHLLAGAAQRGAVALLCFGDPSLDYEHLSSLCEDLQIVAPPLHSNKTRLRGLIASTLPDMVYRYASSEMAKALDRMIASFKPDIIQFEGLELGTYLLKIAERRPYAPRLLFDDHNAEYVLQLRAFETDITELRHAHTAVYSRLQAERLRHFERLVCQAADAVSCVSRLDARALAELALVEVVTVPNAVDVSHYEQQAEFPHVMQEPAILFAGKMDYRPNVDAALWLVDQVMPYVWQKEPEARVYIVGKNPHARLDRLRSMDRVVVTGFVDDMLPYLKQATVCTVPMRIGGGTRLKVLEALAAGKALVSTILGSEGIELENGKHALLADTEDGFANSILLLLSDDKRREALGQAGQTFVRENYDWTTILPRMERVYRRLTP